MTENTDYDLLVIGGGSGGLGMGRRAAEYGVKVCVFEKARLGGTCVNVGCVPKKVMFATSGIKEALEDARGYGFDVPHDVGFNFGALKEKRDAYVERLNGIYLRNLERSKVDLVRGEANFVGPKSLECNGVTYTAPHICIAVGGAPTIPNIPGVENIITSDGFFDLTEIPKKVAVVGAGYIAVELAGILNILGSEVSLFVRGHRALRRFDSMVSTILDEEMTNQGINVVRNTTIGAITKDADGTMSVSPTTDGKEADAIAGFDCILYAIGRKPLVGMGLDKAGIELTNRGYIKTDDFQNTNVPGVYALGDVCGKVELTPVAIAA